MRKIKLKDKKAFEMSFSWMFSLIVGAVIIILAIYSAVRVANNSSRTLNSESAKTLLNILNPVYNSISSGYSTKIDFTRETRVYLGCSEKSERSQTFGKQTIGFSEASGILNKWPYPGENVSRYNKYIYSENMIQTKRIYVFSKPFYTGFRVDDLIMLLSGDYCFISSPETILEELSSLGLNNINFTNRLDNCKKGAKKVCFGTQSGSCDIVVIGNCETGCGDLGEYETGKISRNSSELYYFGNLLYPAIFSSPEIYDCNIKRLGKKAAELSKVYYDKLDIVKEKDCNSVIGPYLQQISLISSNLTQLKLSSLYDTSRLMDSEECSNTQCRIYFSERC